MKMRVLFLVSFGILATIFLHRMRVITDEVNVVSDQYVDKIIHTSWFVGCMQAINDPGECRYIAIKTDWGGLIPQIKEVGESAIPKQD